MKMRSPGLADSLPAGASGRLPARLAGGLLFIYMILALASAASADARLKGWRSARAISLPALDAPAEVYLPLDEAALAETGSLSELRIVDSREGEVPYRMVEERGIPAQYILDTATVWRTPAHVRRQSLVVDARSHPLTPLVARVSLSGARQAVVAVVDGSQDSKSWRELGRARGIPAQNSTVDHLFVRLKPQSDRFFRITLIPSGKSVPRIEDVDLSIETPLPRHAVPVPAQMTVSQDDETRSTLVRLDPGRVTRDLDEVLVDIAEPVFDRPLTVETSDDGRRWSYPQVRAGTSIRRLGQEGPIKLAVDIPRSRMVRLSIGNGSDRPLTIRRAALTRFRRGLIFRAEPGQNYALWYGRQEELPAPIPDYEIERMPLVVPPAKLPMASLGPARALELPWSERHPVLLWSGLILVVALLVGAIIRAMRSTGEEHREPKTDRA